MAGPLHLQKGPAGVVLKVHPVVPLMVCDAFTRRGQSQNRVIGSLLGVVSEGEIIVTNCFTVPHTESMEQVSIDINHHKTMLELHQKVAPTETVIGWFSSGHEVYSVDTLIQDFYANVTANPVYIVVDTSLEKDSLAITAHVSRPVLLKGNHVATEFVEVDCQVQMQEAEKIGLHLLQNGSVESIPTDAEGLLGSFKKLQSMVSEVHEYVHDVVAGKATGDPNIGRYLADTLSMVPFMDCDHFERLFNERLQELLLVLYLSNLVKAQIAIGDKVGTVGSVP
ncbi:hypothetical protein BSKO_09479 [Bryopsis sp. KO-2023]|nr:hypothetical protein BSKO_09479 [Bryopsis sp. KO-2023]